MGPLQVSQEISIGAVAGMSRLRLPARADEEPLHSQELKQVSTLPFADSDQQPA